MPPFPFPASVKNVDIQERSITAPAVVTPLVVNPLTATGSAGLSANLHRTMAHLVSDGSPDALAVSVGPTRTATTANTETRSRVNPATRGWVPEAVNMGWLSLPRLMPPASRHHGDRACEPVHKKRTRRPRSTHA